MMTGVSFLSGAGQAAMVMLVTGMAMLLFRLAKGPTAADRVIALDLLSVLVVAFLVVFSLHARNTTYLDVAIAYACIAFLGTVALVRFIYRTRLRKSSRPGSPEPDQPKGEPHD